MNHQQTSEPSKHQAGTIRTMGLGLAWAILLCGLLFAPVSTVFPQEDGDTIIKQAGLIIEYGDGSIETACVTWAEGFSLTAEQLLTQSGLDVQIGQLDYGGSAVCKIGADGCTIDQGENCYCQYDANSTDSRLWLAYQLKNGTAIGDANRLYDDGSNISAIWHGYAPFNRTGVAGRTAESTDQANHNQNTIARSVSNILYDI